VAHWKAGFAVVRECGALEGGEVRFLPLACTPTGVKPQEGDGGRLDTGQGICLLTREFQGRPVWFAGDVHEARKRKEREVRCRAAGIGTVGAEGRNTDVDGFVRNGLVEAEAVAFALAVEDDISLGREGADRLGVIGRDDRLAVVPGERAGTVGLCHGKDNGNVGAQLRQHAAAEIGEPVSDLENAETGQHAHARHPSAIRISISSASRPSMSMKTSRLCSPRRGARFTLPGVPCST